MLHVAPTSSLRRTAIAGLMLAALAATACSASSSDGPSSPTPPTSVTEVETTSPPSSESSLPSTDPVDAVAASDDLPEVPPVIRGVYSHVYTFWSDKWFHLVDLVKTTELNTVVVDVKDEAGTLLWNIDLPLAKVSKGGEWRNSYDGLKDRLQALKDAGGWAVARVACFKDSKLAKARPELAVQDASGGTWIAKKDTAWLNPYQSEARQWCIDVGKAALDLGFDEVQYDYVRFPNGGDGDISAIQLPGVPDDRPREQWRHSDEIVGFLEQASTQIHDAGGYISADLFGLVTYDFAWDAGGTGQVLERIAQYVDFISPMVYPSHYGPGNYGLKPHPVKYPYDTVWNAMQEAQMRTQELHAKIRPWLEDFPASWVGNPTLTPKHVSEQMRAVYENGIDSWMLWNAANTYTESIFDMGDTATKANADFRPPARTANPDAAPGVKTEQQWPGAPPCDPYPGVLQIGQGNLAGSTSPDLALPYDDPRLCAEVADDEEANATWQQRAKDTSSKGGGKAASAAPSDAPRASGQG